MKEAAGVMHLTLLRNRQLKIILITLCVVWIPAEAMAGSLPEVRVSNVRRAF
jgi:hypothetical protein